MSSVGRAGRHPAPHLARRRHAGAGDGSHARAGGGDRLHAHSFIHTFVTVWSYGVPGTHPLTRSYILTYMDSFAAQTQEQEALNDRGVMCTRGWWFTVHRQTIRWWSEKA